jgi:hypothetical protein
LSDHDKLSDLLYRQGYLPLHDLLSKICEPIFKRWYPDMDLEVEEISVAA